MDVESNQAHQEFITRTLAIREAWSPTRKARQRQLQPEAELGKDMLLQVRRSFSKISKACTALMEAAEAGCVSAAWLQTHGSQEGVTFTKVCKECGTDSNEMRAKLLDLLSASDKAVLRAWDEISGGERKLLEHKP